MNYLPVSLVASFAVAKNLWNLSSRFFSINSFSVSLSTAFTSSKITCAFESVSVWATLEVVSKNEVTWWNGVLMLLHSRLQSSNWFCEAVGCGWIAFQYVSDFEKLEVLVFGRLTSSHHGTLCSCCFMPNFTFFSLHLNITCCCIAYRLPSFLLLSCCVPS